MRIACLALTDQAAALAITICPCLDGTVDIYLPERLRGRPEFQAGAAFGQRYFAKFSQVVPEIFDCSAARAPGGQQADRPGSARP